jgi:hypothetical protein
MKLNTHNYGKNVLTKYFFLSNLLIYTFVLPITGKVFRIIHSLNLTMSSLVLRIMISFHHFSGVILVLGKGKIFNRPRDIYIEINACKLNMLSNVLYPFLNPVWDSEIKPTSSDNSHNLSFRTEVNVLLRHKI